MNKINALAKYLEIEKSNLRQNDYDKNLFKCGNEEYLILTDTQADRYAKEYILNSLWAFNTSFIMGHAKKSFQGMKKHIQEIQEHECENANDFIKGIIKNIKDFIEDAINSDGRGHFISQYDGDEIEHESYYIYRMN